MSMKFTVTAHRRPRNDREVKRLAQQGQRDSGLFFVYREFASLRRAEQCARALAVDSVDVVEIWQEAPGHSGIRVACVCRDVDNRIWTDLTSEGSTLL